ncbi:Wzz/FepE/Etk N-terminal domain-containing protein [Alsobacter soli]|nr:Wzz/FepE/Etk N-terminal domain-containing protein [Alsobacter soli]
MLERPGRVPQYAESALSSEGTLFELSAILDFFQRNASVIAVCALAFAFLGFGVAATTPPKFSSTARILIDSKRVQVASQQAQPASDPATAGSAAESQVELIASNSVILSAIRKLDLVHDPEFVRPPSSLLNKIKGGISDGIASVSRLILPSAPPGEPDVERDIMESIAGNLFVRRVGITFVIEITYSAFTPAKAAQVVNAIAEAYITDELESKYAATKRASIWLQDRINELREQSSTADRLVQDYKSQHNIVDTNRGSMIEQQISELNSQLILARTQTAEAKARLDRIVQVLSSDVPDATVTDALRSEVVSKLRGQLLELRRREAEWSRRYGAQQQAVVSLREEIGQVQKSLRDELQRISETFKSDFDIAKARQDSLEKSMSDLVQNNGEVRQAQIRLRELESAAQVYHNLYETFLQRYTEASQQQTFPIPEARLITPGLPPQRKSSPMTTLYMAMAGVLGGLLGVGVGLVRMMRDHSFHTPAELESATNLGCLSSVPLVHKAPAYRQVPNAEHQSGKIVAFKAGILRHAFDDPFSSFAESIRAIKVNLDMERVPGKCMVVGVVSSIPGEGKTMVASNLAQIVGQSGHRCLLIDCDLRRPALSHALTRHAKQGLLEALAGQPVRDLLHVGGWSRYAFLPCANSARLGSTDNVVSSPSMKLLLENLQDAFDVIILDLPPLIPVVDSRAIAPLVDKFLVVVEWGQTDRTILSEALGLLSDKAQGKIAGTVLNKVDVRAAKRYSTAYAKYYHSAYHSHYVRGA